jgi:hypothetical protein
MVTVAGLVWSEEQVPVANALVRLRNVQSGHVESKTVANAGGEFVFERVAGGMYVVELVDAEDNVQAVGDMVAASPGEVVTTLIVVPIQRPSVGGVFANTASGLVAAAATAGVSGLTDEGRPISAEQ